MFQAPDENGYQPAGTASTIIIIPLECQVIKQEDVHERPGSKTAGGGHTTSPLPQLSDRSDLADRKLNSPSRDTPHGTSGSIT